MNTFDCDVLIIGAGPTGLTLATALASRGIETIIIDRQPEGANTSRAAVVHARTLELLEPSGIADRLNARGIKCRTFSIRDRDRTLLSLDFANLPTPYPYTLMISQAVTESVMHGRLRELGGCVRRPCTLMNLTQTEDGAEAILDDGGRIRARYVVGADGMHSKVRELAGIGFSGASYAQSFLLADVRVTGGVPRDEVVLYFSPAGLAVVAPLPGGIHRIVATVDEAPEIPAVSHIQDVLDQRGPERDAAKVGCILWGSRFRVHHRIADRYRAGHVLLAGDAAHVHSPAGGQGMNLGIQDGIALAHALASVLQEKNAGALERYSSQRRPIAQEVVALTDRLTRIATVRRAFTPLRNAALLTIGRSGAFRRRLALQLAGLPAPAH